MKKKGYAPKWTNIHTKLTKSFEKKLRGGKEIFYCYPDPETMFTLMNSTLEIEKIEHDEYGNHHIHFRSIKK